MGMDKKVYSNDVAHDPGENPQRMAVAASILPLALHNVNVWYYGCYRICNIPNKPSTRATAARPNGLRENSK